MWQTIYQLCRVAHFIRDYRILYGFVLGMPYMPTQSFSFWAGFVGAMLHHGRMHTHAEAYSASPTAKLNAIQTMRRV